jgi:prepilin-type N-terminal cleavage/methylation domain-containing protein
MCSLFTSDGWMRPACGYGSPSRQSGVTLFELVLTLVIIAVLAAVAVSSRSAVNVDAIADAETLKGALRAARTRAMADITPWTLTVAGKTGSFTRNGVDKGAVSFETAGVSPGAITFDNRGQPSGTMAFTVAEYPGGTITVTPVTGYVP